MNEEKPAPEQPVEAKPSIPSPGPASPVARTARRAWRDRSDAVWDEIASLEIELAPGNRAVSPHADPSRSHEPARRQEHGRRPEQARRQDSPGGAKPGQTLLSRDPGAVRGRRTALKIAVIAGATRGIGLALVRALARAWQLRTGST